MSYREVSRMLWRCCAGIGVLIVATVAVLLVWRATRPASPLVNSELEKASRGGVLAPIPPRNHLDRYPDFRGVDVDTLRKASPALPVTLTGLTNKPPNAITMAQVQALSTRDIEAVMSCYLRITNIADRLPLVSVLVAARDPRAVELFRHSLFDEFVDREFPQPTDPARDEELQLMGLVVSLGPFATEDEAVFEFLKQGCDPWFWASAIKWNSHRGSDTIGILVGNAMTALGYSGRDDALDYLRGLRSGALSNPLDRSKNSHTFEGALVSAAFAHWATRQRLGDPQEPQSAMIKPRMTNGEFDKHMRNFVVWKQTPDGRDWSEWAEGVRARRQ